ALVHLQVVHQPQLVDVDRDLRVVAGLQDLEDAAPEIGRRLQIGDGSGRIDRSGHLRLAPHSVVATSRAFSRAARSVCQASVAHFTRMGNSRTPENTTSFPSRSGSGSAPSSVSRRWNARNSRSTSARLFPFRLSVIIDAEALEMAQPEPWKRTSFT